MKVLDLDLDFFLDRAATRIDHYTRDRLPEQDYSPWGAYEVECFLEKQCGLSPAHPIMGKFFKYHHEVFYFWRDIIARGQLKIPFEVVHIDAHADFGLGDTSYFYLLCELLHKDISCRLTPEEGAEKLNPGNFLAFAIACRWINKIVYVKHPDNYRIDIAEFYFENCQTDSGYIQLKSYHIKSLRENLHDIRRLPPTALEPKVPICITTLQDFKESTNYDFVCLTQSQGYTPKSSDELLPIIKKYIQTF